MKNLITFPPNYQEILKIFPSIVGKPVVFAYGDVLYNPTGAFIPLDLETHEKTHQKQQQDFRGGVVQWWKEYLVNPNFRLEQEAEAYRAQYKFFIKEEAGAKTRGRQIRKQFLHRISRDLSSAMYGNLCSYERARKLIADYD